MSETPRTDGKPPTEDEKPPRVVYLPPRHEWLKMEDPDKRKPVQPLPGRIRRGR